MNAFILTGGMSRRFGSDKALAKIQDKSFTQHLFEMLSQEFEKVTVVGKVQHFKNLPFVFDRSPVQCPLVGIFSGLTASNADWNFFLSVDLPLMQTEVIDFLRQKICQEEKVIVPRSNERVHPLCGFYHRSLSQRIAQALRNENYRMMDFLEREHAKLVDASRFEQAFFNVNTPEAYQELINFVRKK